jgi:DNA-directed RNA polymerase specialized sigma24 family protein
VLLRLVTANRDIECVLALRWGLRQRTAPAPSLIVARRPKAVRGGRRAARDIVNDEQGLSEVAFARLLAWLDEGVDSGGETYLEMRRRLVSYFDRRQRPSPDELADETFNRIARTLEDEGVIEVTPPARYCYVVARFVMLEDVRRRDHAHISLDESRAVDASAGSRQTRHESDEEAHAQRERRLDCLDRCLQQLTSAQRELIVEYYRDERRRKIERRRDLAIRLGISMNALGIRSSRIRATLEACVGACGGER